MYVLYDLCCWNKSALREKNLTNMAKHVLLIEKYTNLILLEYLVGSSYVLLLPLLSSSFLKRTILLNIIRKKS